MNVYLDHAATTPVRPEVVEAMLPYLTDFYGNSSSIHGIGRKAHAGLDGARRTIADILGAKTNEIIFTSGGSESDNTALRGIALARRRQTGANRIVTTVVEHKAVLETALDLRDHFGFDVTLIPVDGDGMARVDDVAPLLGEDVAVVSVMLANNEVGTIQPVGEIGAICRARGIPFHTDAVQAAGKLPLDVHSLRVDALSGGAHKFYGPKGVGFLYLRQGTPFQPTLTGGSHEGSRRAGTENVAGIVAMAKALELAEIEREVEMRRLQLLRDWLIGGILEKVDGVHLTGSPFHRLPNHASFLINGVEAEGVLIGLDLAGIAASSGSACTSAAQKPSHVLEAMGIPAQDAVGGLRLSLGRSNTPEQIEYVLAKLPRIVEQIRGSVPIAF
ncbi:MAG: cysteine desulfurase [Caldilineaceae bacterium]|nr:cysteine desulfurase [Caldilineaceae bacterium]